MRGRQIKKEEAGVFPNNPPPNTIPPPTHFPTVFFFFSLSRPTLPSSQLRKGKWKKVLTQVFFFLLPRLFSTINPPSFSPLRHQLWPERPLSERPLCLRWRLAGATLRGAVLRSAVPSARDLWQWYLYLPQGLERKTLHNSGLWSPGPVPWKGKVSPDGRRGRSREIQVSPDSLFPNNKCSFFSAPLIGLVSFFPAVTVRMDGRGSFASTQWKETARMTRITTKVRQGTLTYYNNCQLTKLV